MNEKSRKLDHKWEVLIAALLTERTYEDAANKAGLSVATVTRWLRRPKFVAAYRTARRRVVEVAIGRVQAVLNKAIETLERNLTTGLPNSEIAAAKAILDFASKGLELYDFDEIREKVEEIKTAVKGHQSGRGGKGVADEE